MSVLQESDRIRDAGLMAKVADGDRLAQRQIVDRHLGPIYGLAWRMLKNVAGAEDVCQDAFLRLWQIAARWQPDAKVGTWLYRVAYNLSIDELRRQKRWSDEEAPDIPDPSPDVLAQHHSSDIAIAVEAAMAKLPVRQRTAVTLVHHQELSNIEAAEIMQISVEAIESLLARGRRKLRDLLADQRAELMETL
jgi:RNA polymerase sigma-70 factor (ECF subfamily)